ncbi:MAG TPA: DUF1631 family protein, partial [Spongiibacteraceae bacterium]|nr:DUF1631 family protein [Spongiibacteraceae bacterium]
MAIRTPPADLHLTPARKGELLRSLDSFFLQRVKDLLDLFFDEAEFRLFSAAQNAPTNQQQTLRLETLAQLKRNRETIEIETLDSLQQGKIPAPTTQSSAGNEQLSLIEHDVLEAQLLLETIIRKADQRWFEPLYCLAKRYSVLRGAAIDTHDLPMGVVAISRIVDAGLRPLIPLALLPTMLQAFDRSVLHHIGEIYDALNERLKQWGVLPNLEIDLWRELYQGKIGARDHPAPTAIIDTAPTPEESPFTTSATEVASTELYSTARQILQLIRHPSVGNGTTASDVDDREAVLKILAELQQQAGDNSTPLLQRLRDHAESQHTNAPDGASTDSLRFVDTLFAEINAALQSAPALLESLQKLQIPLARATVEEPELLGNADHPVHQFINLLMKLTAHTDLPNAPLEQKLSGVIEPIANDTADPQQLFAEASSDLAPLLAQQQKARERNIRRIVDTYQGQQQLTQAQAAVDRELQRRNASTQTPALVLQLLEQGWRHILTLTFMRQGDNSGEWSEYFALLDELLWRLNAASSPEALQAAAIKQWHKETKQLAERIGKLLDDFFPGDYRNVTLVEALQQALLGETPIETAPTPHPKAQASVNPRELQLELDNAYP